MALEVEWSESALASLSEAIEYVSRDSPSYAAALVLQADSAGRSLAQFPDRGRLVGEYSDPLVREIFVGKSFRLIYRTGSQHVLIVAFVHVARDLGSLV